MGDTILSKPSEADIIQLPSKALSNTIEVPYRPKPTPEIVVTTELANGDMTPLNPSPGAEPASHNPATPLSKLAGTIPVSVINENLDPLPIAQAAIIQLQVMDTALLTEDTLWRDIFALTGTTRTFNGVQLVHDTWKKLTKLHKPCDFKIAPQNGITVMRSHAMPTLQWIQVKFTFRTQGDPKMKCHGLMRLIPGEHQDWKIWLLTTLLQGVEGFPNVDNLAPTISQQSPTPPPELEVQNCVIIGAGMSGLCLAGYMKALGIPAIILEKNERVGQTWEERYDSVSIHTSRACGQLPFENVWGPEYPYHLTVKDVVEGYTTWVKKYLPDEIWTSTELIKAYWNEKESTWRLAIKQNGTAREIQTRHLVFALGLCTLPYIPDFPNRDTYKGLLLHGSEYKNANEWKGLKGVIIGTANTAHDCADDMLKAGLSSVTMVQRNPTPVLPVEYYSKIYDPVYNDKMPTHISDMMMVSTPNAITRLMSQTVIAKMMGAESERFDALERRGFKTVRGMDFDLYHCLLERFGSHYIDVGVSKKIADGLIKVKSDASISGFDEKGLVFDDGSTLEADVVICATGYEGNMRHLAAPLLEESVASKLHDYWQVDDEGEVRGAWKPIGHPNVWYTGGNVLYMRYFAKFLAMFLAADIKGTPLPVYEKKYE